MNKASLEGFSSLPKTFLFHDLPPAEDKTRTRYVRCASMSQAERGYPDTTPSLFLPVGVDAACNPFHPAAGEILKQHLV